MDHDLYEVIDLKTEENKALPDWVMQLEDIKSDILKIRDNLNEKEQFKLKLDLNKFLSYYF